MDKIKVVLQNNKEFVTEIEAYDALELTKEIRESEDMIVAIGSLVVNKHHIEIIHKL